MSKQIRTAWLSDVVDIIDNPETNRIVCHDKEFALVKHGHWYKKDGWYWCSVCGDHWGDDGANFCPNCGAEMEEVKDEIN